MLLAGFARTDITPPIPCEMGGYADRRGQASGVADPLFARALVLDGGDVRLGLVVADVLGVDAGLCAAVETRLGGAAERWMVAATHTHSGPAVPVPWAADGDEAEPRSSLARWWKSLPSRLANVVVEAGTRLEPAEVSWGFAPAPGVGASRHDPNRSAAPPVSVLRFCRPGGDPLGLLVHYPCHPTILGADHLTLSADFPGAALAELESAGVGWSLFVNGAAGDLSTRFTRTAQDLAEVRRMGGMLAAAALRAAAGATPVPAPRLRPIAQRVDLAPKPPPDPADVARRLAWAKQRVDELIRGDAPAAVVREAYTALQGARLEADLARRAPSQETTVTLRGWALGDEVAMVAYPGEPFSSLAAAVARDSPFAATWCLGYAGGYAGYFPDREAYGASTYEALAAPWAPGCGETLARAAIKLTRELRNR